MTNTKTESDDEEKARLLDGPLRNVNEIEDVPHRARLAWVQVRAAEKSEAPVDYERTRYPALLRRPRGAWLVPISRNMTATKTQPTITDSTRILSMCAPGSSWTRSSSAAAGAAKRLREYDIPLRSTTYLRAFKPSEIVSPATR
jgi:hypothetical protein